MIITVSLYKYSSCIILYKHSPYVEFEYLLFCFAEICDIYLYSGKVTFQQVFGKQEIQQKGINLRAIRILGERTISDDEKGIIYNNVE